MLKRVDHLKKGFDMKLTTTIGGAMAGIAMMFAANTANATVLNLGPVSVTETYEYDNYGDGAYLHILNGGFTSITNFTVSGGFAGGSYSATHLANGSSYDFYLGDNEINVPGSQGTAKISFSYLGQSYSGSFTDVLGDPDAGTSPISVTLDPTTGGAVPEPASWLLMLTGFGLMATALRKRSQGRSQSKKFALDTNAFA